MFSLEYLPNIPLCLILTCILYRIFESCLSLRPRNWARLCFFLTLFGLSSPIILPGEATATLGILLFLTLAVLLFCSDPFWVKIAITLILYPLWISFYYLSENLGFVIWYYVFDKQLSLLWENLLSVGCSLLRIPFLLLVLWFVKKWLSPSRIHFPPNIWAVIAASCLASFLGVITLIAQADTLRTYIIWPACAACILTNLSVCYLCAFLSRSARESMEADLLRARQEHYEEIKKEQEKTRDLRHDMNNHLLVIQNLLLWGKADQAQAYLRGLTGQFSAPSRNFCENETINALLSVKYRLAAEKGIGCSFLPDLPARLDLDMVRLCSLIANTLDNAIEANEKITPASRRRILLKSRCADGYFSYYIENPLLENPPLFQSAKKDPKFHGRGLPIVRDLVGRLRGTIEISRSEDTFSVTILIPLR